MAVLAVLAMILALTGLACTFPAGPFVPTPTPAPPPTPTPLPAVPPDENIPPPGEWLALAPGLELRAARIPASAPPYEVQALVVRVDPARSAFRVHYDPANPATIEEWHQRTGAAVTVNGGFFLPNKTTLGLLVADGVRYGDTFARTGYAGMFSVVGGIASVRSLGQFPYDPAEPLDQAVQGRPMLLYPGRLPVEFTLAPDPARRTAIAQDGDGNIYLIVVDMGALTLYDLRDWMAVTEEFPFWAAFNLDGGSSTGLAISAGGYDVLVGSPALIPAVIAVYPGQPPP